MSSTTLDRPAVFGGNEPTAAEIVAALIAPMTDELGQPKVYAHPEPVTITPAMARELLRLNTRNRALKDKNKAKKVRDMRAGAWDVNGDAVKISRPFDSSGRVLVLDGQHRLEACVEAGVPFRTFLITGLDPDTQATMDSHTPRSVKDMLDIKGEQYTTILSAVLRRVWYWDHGDRRFSANTTPTHRELDALLKERPGLVRSAEIASRVYQTFRSITPTNVGTAHHLCSRVDEGDAAEFFAILGTGAKIDVGHPVHALRQRTYLDGERSKNVEPYQQLAYIIHAWNKYRDGKELRAFKPLEPNKPMPEPR